MPGTTQTLEPSVANPPGAGLVIRRRAVQVSQIEITEPKIPQPLHTTKQDKDSWAHTKYIHIHVCVHTHTTPYIELLSFKSSRG